MLSRMSVFRRSAPSFRRPVPPGDQTVLLEQFTRELAGAESRSSLTSIIGLRFLEFSKCQTGVLFEISPPESRYLATHFIGAGPRTPVLPCFGARGRLAKWLSVNEEPLVPSEHLGVLTFLSESERSLLSDLSAAICVPLLAGGRMDAVLVLGASENSWRPSHNLVSFLRSVGQAAAVALAGMAAREAQRNRLQAETRAQQLAVAGQLASAVAHEVRNPLTTIRSSVQHVLESSAEWSQKTELLHQVIGEVDRINRTVSSLLTLSRPPSLTLVDLDLAAVVQEAVTFVKPYVEHHQLLLRQAFGDGLPVRADSGQLRQVLLNILLNACQATPAGGAISIAGEVRSAMAIVTVTDTGCGIPAADLSRVCEPFFTTKAMGSGLGLAISAQIMMQHCGSLLVESQVDQGTTISLMLPLRG